MKRITLTHHKKNKQKHNFTDPKKNQIQILLFTLKKNFELIHSSTKEKKRKQEQKKKIT